MSDIQRIQELISYNPDSGVFTWKKTTSNRVKVGATAGNMSHGYREISIDGKTYRAHRLAWLLAHGRWPSVYIDHINGLTDDNRLCNLREASTRENAWNTRTHADNLSGLKGVTYDRGVYRRRRPWAARICVNGKRQHLGYFATPEAAHLAYMRAAQAVFGQFARAA
jgi:hypothetical protein